MEPIRVTLRGLLGGRPVRFDLGPGVHTLGRATSCEVQIDEPSVSRQHARIHVDDGGVAIEDLGSSNGTRVGGKDVTGPTRLKHGDEVALGNLRLRMETSDGVLYRNDWFPVGKLGFAFRTGDRTAIYYTRETKHLSGLKRPE